MRRPTLLGLTFLFSVLGIADSWYLATHEITNTALSCGLGGGALSGCNIVAQSPYSHLFGIPLGVYGLIFYGAVFIITGILYVARSQRIVQLLFGISVISTILSIYFVGIQIFVIKAICVYCFGSFFLSLGIFATSLMLVRTRPEGPPLM